MRNMLARLYGKISENKNIDGLVFGEGRENADILLIGEAPGKDEVSQGKPFVGKAGRNLSEFLEALELSREDIFITNAVKFRPTKTSEKGTVSNRPPTWDEVLDFRQALMGEIEIISPSIIVTLGNTPLRSVLYDKKACIGDYHGRITRAGERLVFALYHPASIIYNRALRTVYDEDIAKLKELVNNIKKASQ